MIYTLVLLGNPGEKYTRTRHNIARILFEHIRSDVEALTLDPQCLSTVETFVPDTFMNESGKAVKEYLRYREGREIVVLYDDKDLAIGTIRVSFGRGDGGHNGLKSIIEELSDKDFVRIRIGIAPSDVDGKEVMPPHGDAVQGFVMGKIRDDEEEKIREVAPLVLGAIKTILQDGYQKAMEVYN